MKESLEKILKEQGEIVKYLKQSVSVLTKGFYDLKNEKKKHDLDKQFSLINVPSKGLFYPGNKDYFLVNYLTAKEEHILTDQFLMERGIGIEIVLNNAIRDDFEAKNLTYGDYQAILIFLRSTAYGDEIVLTPTCPHCGKQNDQPIKLSSLQFTEPQNEPNEDGCYILEIANLNLEFKIKPSTLGDEINKINKKEKEDDFIKIKNDGETLKIKRNSLLDLTSQIKEINGESDSEIIKTVVRKLPKNIISKIRDFLKKNQTFLKEDFLYECPFCSGESTQNMHIGHEFLTIPPSYKEHILEEVFLLTHYGQSITREDAMKMPVYERKWYIRRIKEEIDKKNEAERRAMNRAKSKSGKKF